MAKISNKIKNIVLEKVNFFNQNELGNNSSFKVEIRGSFIYLKLNSEPRCRLKYDGDIESLEFSIFKFSSSKYDPDEFFFPGSEYVDGTIEGALKASLKAYQN